MSQNVNRSWDGKGMGRAHWQEGQANEGGQTQKGLEEGHSRGKKAGRFIVWAVLYEADHLPV